MLINPSTGQLYKEGEIMKHKNLANTLEAIANEGPDAFYNGSLTQDILLDVQDAGRSIVKYINKRIKSEESLSSRIFIALCPDSYPFSISS